MEQIEDNGEVQPTFGRAVLRHVRHPDAIGRVMGERTSDVIVPQFLRPTMPPTPPPSMDALETVEARQAYHTVAGDALHELFAQLGVDPPGAVRAATVDVDCLDDVRQRSVCDVSRRRGTPIPGLASEEGGRTTQDLTCLAQDRVLTTQLAELVTLRSRETRHIASVNLMAFHRCAKPLVTDTEILRDLRKPLPARLDETNGFLTKLR